jgi:hypothetical protein
VLANINRDESKRPEAFSPADFIPDPFRPADDEPPDEAAILEQRDRALKAFFAPFAGNTLNGDAR